MKALGNQNIIKFFIAHILSAFGYEFIFFVMTIYVYEVSQSAFKVGIFSALTFLPRLFASFYGIAIDKYNKPRLFAGVAITIGCLISIMAFNTDMNFIYFIWFFISLFLISVSTVRSALMTEVVVQDNYLRGNSMTLISLNLAKISAPLLAGLASGSLGIKSLFFLTGAIYFVIAVISMRIDTPTIEKGKTTKNIVTDLKDGLRYMKQSMDLKFLISVGVLWRVSVGLQVSLFVVYIKAYLQGTDADYGMFMTIIGVGSILGSIIGPWIIRKISYRAVIFYGMSIHYITFIAFGFLHSIYLTFLTGFFSYVVFYATLVGLHSLRDESTRVDMRGRVYGSVTAILALPAIVSMLAGGYLVNMFGVDRVLIGAGVLALVSFYILYAIKKFNEREAKKCFES